MPGHPCPRHDLTTEAPEVDALRSEVSALKREVERLKETLAFVQRLPDLEWAQVTASIMVRLASFSRAGETEAAKTMMAVLDKGKTYVSRTLAERDTALAEAADARKTHLDAFEKYAQECRENERAACSALVRSYSAKVISTVTGRTELFELDALADLILERGK